MKFVSFLLSWTCLGFIWFAAWVNAYLPDNWINSWYGFPLMMTELFLGIVALLTSVGSIAIFLGEDD